MVAHHKTPVYKKLPTANTNGKTNIKHLENKSGVYRLFENGKLVYVGFSGSNLYKTILRHFQKWTDIGQRERISYSDELGEKRYSVQATECSPEKARVIELGLIIKLKPRDNKQKLELWQQYGRGKQVDTIFGEYRDAQKAEADRAEAEAARKLADFIKDNPVPF